MSVAEMSIHERIVTALKGEMPDRVPWTIYAGLLPRGGVERRLRNKELGLVSYPLVYATQRPHVNLAERSIEENGETVQVRTYQTPLGELTEKRRTEPGYNSSWILEYFVKQPRDYEILEFIIRDTVYRPDYSVFVRARGEMGDDGLVGARILRVPYQRLWIEFTGLDRLLLDLNDCPDLVGRVVQAIDEKDRELWEVVAASPSDDVWCPDNVTAQAMAPRLWDHYLAPYYEALGEVMHRHGKRVIVHIDGATRMLVDRIARTPIDVIEAFTPMPTGDLTLAEARAAWKDKAIWINFPSSVHVEEPDEVAAMTGELLRQAAPGNGFLMGVTENVPDAVYARSLGAITEVIDRFGACPLAG
ncbi:MAG: hypothetical protein HYY04_12430 [Chloroflexi bacterium]|nr:hypothetical protein [Chloroflexota bacterium]